MNKESIKSLILAVIISVIGILISYFLSLKVNTQLKTQNHLKIENIAKQVSIRFQDALDISFNDLQALQAFYSVNKQHGSKDEFNQYMNILNIENRHYIQALSWVPLVKDKEKNSFEASVRNQQPNFTITERNTEGEVIASSSKPYYTPVTYISPFEANKAAIGFDLNSNNKRRQSLEYARDSGKMTTTAKIRLVQEKRHSVGFLIIAPVYKQNIPLSNSQERINALLGYVTGVFRIDTLMESAKEQADKEGLELTLLDMNKDSGGLLYGKKESAAAFTFNVTVPDRNWQLNISLTEKLLKSIESPSIVTWILFGGILVSLLLGLSIFALQISVIRARSITHLSKRLQNQNIELETKVVERTKTLADKNSQLSEKIDEINAQRVELSNLMKTSEATKLSAEQRARELARSNKDLDDFAYVASHDLKAPLRGIDQLALWITEDIEENNFEEIPEHLKMMRNRVQRLEALLNDLLAYSRANRQENNVTLINSGELINELFILISPPDGFTLTVHGDSPIFHTVSPPFEQVIRNLLHNAIKHHHQQKGHIKVNIIEQGDFYQFRIEDDGPGIKSDYFNDIFKMFKTLKSRDEKEGSGMGLALVKKIIEYYSGQINVESTLGRGSVFYFTWPKNINQPKS